MVLPRGLIANHRGFFFHQGAVAIIGHGLMDLLLVVHHKGPVLHDRFTDGLSRHQNKARRITSGRYCYLIPIIQHDKTVGGNVLSADLYAAFI